MANARFSRITKVGMTFAVAHTHTHTQATYPNRAEWKKNRRKTVAKTNRELKFSNL